MSKRVDPASFANSVVSSSKPDLSIEEKFDIYVKAFEFAENKNNNRNAPKAKIVGNKCI